MFMKVYMGAYYATRAIAETRPSSELLPVLDIQTAPLNGLTQGTERSYMFLSHFANPSITQPHGSLGAPLAVPSGVGVAPFDKATPLGTATWCPHRKA